EYRGKESSGKILALLATARRAGKPFIPIPVFSQAETHAPGVFFCYVIKRKRKAFCCAEGFFYI
ncbi:hypothetical protein, partial [Yersinia kristensenii]|uniref:hypothetical protein n=1 Tax=Yersinia kristensenii TaxID=28152 RepID=UPI001C110A2B